MIHSVTQIHFVLMLLACPQARDCWSVCFGNSFNNEERSVCAGYDNGDIKLYDLRTNQIRSAPAPARRRAYQHSVDFVPEAACSLRT
jgi:hypothetical protein